MQESIRIRRLRSHGGFWPANLFSSMKCTRSILWPRAKHTEESYKHFIPVGILGSTMNGEQKKISYQEKKRSFRTFIRDCFRDDRDRFDVLSSLFFFFLFFLFAVKWEHSTRSVTMSQKDFVFFRIPCDCMNMRFFREKGVEIYCFNVAKMWIRFSISRCQPTRVLNVLLPFWKSKMFASSSRCSSLFIIAAIIL